MLSRHTRSKFWRDAYLVALDNLMGDDGDDGKRLKERDPMVAARMAAEFADASVEIERERRQR